MSGRSARALHAALAVLLLLGVAGYVRSDKHVTLVVDGRARTVDTRAGDVGQLLAEQHLALTWRDAVSPGASTTLLDGMEVAVRFARPVALTVDGHDAEVWTTAVTVDEVLDDLGLRVQAASLSTSRGSTIPRTGLDVDVQLPDQITFRHDGRRTTLLTTAATIGAAMREAGVRLGRLDRSDAALATPVQDGMVVTVTRIDRRVVHRPFRIARSVVRRTTDALYSGAVSVVRRGHDGRGLRTVRVTVEDGVVVRRVLVARTVVRRPLARVLGVGTKVRVWAPPGTGVGDLNWAALAQCESSGNSGAVNPAGYYGLYQFDLSTWASVGGSGNPVDASAAEQTYRAQVLYRSRGTAPWPVCGWLLLT